MTPRPGQRVRGASGVAQELDDAGQRAHGTAPGLHVAEPWPHGISRQPTMRISDVLAALSVEFPAVSTSKLRFLEDQGLVTPFRTPAGYRQYSPADVERLRYVLRLQRDRYLPLKVIGDQLAALDAGTSEEPVVAARLATRDGVTQRPALADRRTPAQLAEDAGVDVALVEGLLDAGIIQVTAEGHLDTWARPVVVAAGALREHGIDPRHLRSFRSAADRQVDLIEQIVTPLRGQGGPTARAHAGTVAAEVGELCAALHTALVRASVARLAP